MAVGTDGNADRVETHRYCCGHVVRGSTNDRYGSFVVTAAIVVAIGDVHVLTVRADRYASGNMPDHYGAANDRLTRGVNNCDHSAPACIRYIRKGCGEQIGRAH